MNRWTRLVIILIVDVAAMCALAAALMLLRDVLEIRGYVLSPPIFIFTFFISMGVLNSFAIKLIKQEFPKKQIKE